MTSCNRNLRKNNCPCSYTDEQGNFCIHKGKCCVCIAHHKKNNELPACYFTKEQEKTYDRSIDNWWHNNGACSCHKHEEK